MTLALDPSTPRSASFVSEVRRRASELHARLDEARTRGDSDQVQHCLDEIEDLRDTAVRGDIPLYLADVPELWGP